MKLIFIILCTFSTGALADVITCVFTEPFVTSTYSTPKSILRYKSMDGSVKALSKVSFQIKAEGVFELVSREGKVIQTLTLNHKGSDGMSDHQYPYEVKDSDSLTHKGIGACSSNFLKVLKK